MNHRRFAAELGGGPLVIGCDGRASGPGFAQEIGRELARAGIMVQLAGVASTPTVGQPFWHAN